MRIKKTTCHRCGAVKARRSPTAWIFCDFCGALTDFDFQRSVTDPRSKRPGPAYEALLAQVAPLLQQARATRDGMTYLTLQRQLLWAWVDACPASCSPRVADPSYRLRFVDFRAQWATLLAFEPSLAAAVERQTAAVAAMRWAVPARLADPERFWTLVAAVEHLQSVSREVAQRSQVPSLNPDGDTPVNERIEASVFVQGWLPYLAPEVGEVLLERFGLQGEYVELIEGTFERLPCGACKADGFRAEGAQRCVCDGCGRLLRADAFVPCTNCGAKLLAPAEEPAFSCPFCEAELRAMTSAG